MIFLGLKYLLSRRKQTLLMLLGIFFGSAAYVSISGFMLGFREYLIDQLVNNNPHIHIQSREDFLTDHSLDEAFFGKKNSFIFWDPPPSGRKDSAIIENPQSWFERLSLDPRVLAYSPILTASVIFSNGKATVPANVVGCDPVQQIKVTNIGNYIVEGSFSDLASGGNRLIIGEELKKRLGVRVEQNVLLSLAKSSPTPFKIVGVYKTGNKLSDALAYGALGDIQKVNQALNQINQISVRVRDYTQAAMMAISWSTLAPEKVQSWDQINESIFNVFRIQDAVRFLSIGAIMIVAAFGIYNVLNMTVMQKRRDVAILRSMGYSTGEIVSLFFTQGLILGLTGTVSGLVFGYFLSIYLKTLPFRGPMGGPGHMMVSMDPQIYIHAALLALGSACLASILPAYGAGKLEPIEIIRTGAE
jgi:lipoprotein-releasing system permease protein